MADVADSGPDDGSYGCFGIVCIWMTRAMMLWAVVAMPWAAAIGFGSAAKGFTIAIPALLAVMGLAGVAFSVRRWSNPPAWAALLAKCDPDELRGKRARPIIRSSRPGWRNPFDYTGEGGRGDG
ncbi:MAG: hypothetical protein ACT4PX_11545 [Actinomycetota bacterium]